MYDPHALALGHSSGVVSIWLMNGGWYIGESALLPMDPAWQLRGLLPQGFQRLDLQEDPPGKDGWKASTAWGRRPAARLGDYPHRPDPPFSAEPC